jgi:hypothetical protein
MPGLKKMAVFNKAGHPMNINEQDFDPKIHFVEKPKKAAPKKVESKKAEPKTEAKSKK